MDKNKENCKSEICIRVANINDVEKLLRIYAPYVEKTAITFEYDVPSVEEFAARVRKVQEKYPYLVAEDGDEILGYAYLSAFHERAAYDWAVETSIYVDETKKRMGLGRMLYDALEMCARAQHILNLNACIAVPSKREDEHLTFDSVRFHDRLGYRMVGEFDRCGYKFAHWYNMVWMEKHIGNHTETPERVCKFSEVEELVVKKLL